LSVAGALRATFNAGVRLRRQIPPSAFGENIVIVFEEADPPRQATRLPYN